MPALPCRCRAALRSARREEFGHFCRYRAARARRRHGQTALSSPGAAFHPGPRYPRWSRSGILRSFNPLGMQAFPHDRPDAVRHDVAWRSAIDDDAASWFLACQRPIGLAKFFMKLNRLRLKAIGGILSASASSPRQPDLRGHIQDESEFRKCRADGNALKAPDQALVDVAHHALIRARRIDEAV